ncbi:hypothetical protein KAI52_00005 [Candidatus Parcubacteria bacterium]|nr:hypothetical protein [Candidatus Parcubacteria bacterium]
MTKATLRSKWYYRLLIVIYIGFFLLISLITVYSNFDSVGNHQTDFEVKCHFGNKETFFAYQDKNIFVNRYAEVPDPENWRSSQAPNDWSVMTVATEGCGLLKSSTQVLLDTGSNIFNAKLKKVNVITYGHAIFWSILIIAITALVFEVIRKIFYFITLDTLFPKKDKK